MPIGWTIGLTLGFIICGYALLTTRTRKTIDLIGSTMFIVSLLAFIGTIIELIVR